MEYNVMQNVNKYNKKHQRRNRWLKAVSAMACIVVFCTVYALILPAITQEKEVTCGKEEHQHNESCYIGTGTEYARDTEKSPVTSTTTTMTCQAGSAHRHGEGCFDGKGRNICGQSGYIAHSHDTLCYDEAGALICTLTEAGQHEHTDNCYDIVEKEPAVEGHKHAEGCYTTEQGELQCGQEEAAAEAVAQAEAHTHSEACYAVKQVLTCGLEEKESKEAVVEKTLVCKEPKAEVHVHTTDCVKVTKNNDTAAASETNAKTETNVTDKDDTVCNLEEHTHDLGCYVDKEADVETAEDWEKTFEDVELTGIWKEDVILIAESQLGYTESTKNYVVDKNTEKPKGYTRYGAWYGNPYGDWCAMFASFCLHYAGVEDMPLDAGVINWIRKLSAEDIDLYREAGDYQPEPSDLIFFNNEGPDVVDHVGIVVELIPATEKEPAKIKTIEGNSSNKVQYVTYEADDEQIVGYGKLPEQPDRKFNYSDDNVQVEVVLPKETKIAKDAVLKVTEIKSEDDEYAELEAKAAEAVEEGIVSKAKFYDISFYTADEEYIPVDDRAKVTMQFSECIIDEKAEVAILHYEDEKSTPEVIENANVDPGTEGTVAAKKETGFGVSTMLLTTSEEVGTEIAFETDGFSTFAVVQVETGAYVGKIIDPLTRAEKVAEDKYDALTGLGNNGKKYIIVSADMKYALSSYAEVDNKGEDKLKGMEVLWHKGEKVGDKVYVNANKHLLWEFVNTGKDGLIYIKSVATGEYLQLVRNGVAITTGMLPDDDLLKNRQMIHAIKDVNSNKVGFCVKVNGTHYYLNRDGGGKLFHTYNKGFAESQNNQFYLCEYDEQGADSKVDEVKVSNGVDIGDSDMAYIIAGVNYNNEASGNPTVLTGTETEQNVAINNTNTDTYGVPSLQGQEATTAVVDGKEVKSLSYEGTGDHIWIFEDSDEDNSVAIRNAATGQYLHINSDSAGIKLDEDKQKITIQDATEIKDNALINVNVKNLSVDGYYLFLYGNLVGKDFTALKTYKNMAVDTSRYETHLVLYEYGKLIGGLQGNSYIISGVNNKDARLAVLTSTVDNNDQNKLLSKYTGVEVSEAGGAVTSINVDSSKDVAWTFEDAGVFGTYYIKSASGKYLSIKNGSLSLGEDKQKIEVVAADLEHNDQGKTITKNVISLRAAGQNDYLQLAENNVANGFVGFHAEETKDVANRGNYLVLTKYDANANMNTPLATDLGDKVYFAVAVNNDQKDADPPALSSTSCGNTNIIGEGNMGLTGRRVDVSLISGDKDTFEPAEIDQYNDLGWYFEAVDGKPGTYYIRAVNGAAKDQYLNFAMDGNKTQLKTSTNKQEIEVVAADTTGADVMENVVCLRAHVNGAYHHIYLSQNNVGRNFGSHPAADVNTSNKQTHFVLIEIEEVNEVVEMINNLIDNMVLSKYQESTNGEEHEVYQFSDAGWVGSSHDDENNDGQQGKGNSNEYGAEFVDDYDQAQAYRSEMQQLARKAKAAYDKLTDDEKRYVYNSKELLDKMEWLWRTMGTVSSVNVNATVKLYNYSGSVNETSLAKKGFTFYHKAQFDAYTALVSTNRHNSQNLGCGETALYFKNTLVNGYPVVTGGKGVDPDGPLKDEEGTLNYLFNDPVATMNNGGGLFQQDAEGYFYYYSNENAAYYSGTGTPIDTDGDGITDNTQVNDGGQFILYDHVLRPMYVDGDKPNAVNNVYNFLPFNNPETAICDPVNTLPSNTAGEMNEVLGLNDGSSPTTPPNPQYTKIYAGEAKNKANREKSAYINERADMWYGMTIDMNFLMPKNGKVKSLVTGEYQDMIFDFYGDDDVLVYIDDVLVLDIGGVHGAEVGNINYATGKIENPKGINDGKTLKELFEEAGKDTSSKSFTGETCAEFTTHTLKFFYVERGGNVAYAGIRFNFPDLPDNYLLVNKNLDYDATFGENKPELSADQYYTFRVIQADAEGNPILDTNGKEQAFFAPGTNFEIWKDGEPVRSTDDAGNIVTLTDMIDDEGYFSVKNGYAAMFPDVLEHRANENCNTYIVQEIVPGGENTQYSVITNTVVNVDGTTYENKILKGEGAVEVKPNDDSAYTYTGVHVNAGNSVTSNFNNTVTTPLGKLQITKQVTEGSTIDSNEEFEIKVELGDMVRTRAGLTQSMSPIAVGTKYILSGTGVNDTNKNQTVTKEGYITIKAGQTATIDGLLAGTVYNVSEVTEGENYTPFYEGTVEADNPADKGSDPVGSGDGITGIFGSKNTVKIIITNTSYDFAAYVPIKKNVTAAGGSDTFEFEIIQGDVANDKWTPRENVGLPGVSITIPGNSQPITDHAVIGIKATDITDENDGKFYYMISEKNNGGDYIYDDTKYVIEITTSKEDKVASWTDTWIVTDENGTLQNVATPGGALNFTNQRTTDLTITKKVKGGSSSENFRFNVQVTDIDGNKTTYTETLKADGTAKLTGIPINATVVITEENPGNMIPSYQVTAGFEAELGTLNGVELVSSDLAANASGGAVIGNINAARTVTTNITSAPAGNAELKFYYESRSTRSFKITVNGNEYSVTGLNSGAWHAWPGKEGTITATAEDGTVTNVPVELNAGDNTIVFSGDGSDAPNLDYFTLTYPEQDGVTATIEAIQGPAEVVFTNSVTYSLPESGGEGTIWYILWGSILMLGPVIYRYSVRRKSERRAAE